jgi:hypothetical protein
VSIPAAPGERHLRNIRQLTAAVRKAYFSADGIGSCFRRVTGACDQE